MTIQSLKKKQLEMMDLAKKLEGSLSIQQIWPEAFDSNLPVRLKGKQRMLPGNRRRIGFIQAWFECRDGRKYHLTVEELKQHKHAAIIHPNYIKEG